MDPSVLLKQRSVQWSDPLDDYSKLQTLRQMMDQRRIREQQYQMHQLAMQKSQQEMADEQRMRQALAGGIQPGTTLSSLLQQFGPKGLDIHKALQQAQTDEDTRKTATLTRQQKEAELVRKRMQDRADVLYSVQGQGQPATDEAVMMDLLKPENQRLGLGRIGQETPLALTEPQLRAQYSEAYTPGAWQALKKGEAEAKSQDLKLNEDQFKAAYPLLAGANDQDAWTAAIKALPIHQQPLIPPRFNAANKQKALSMWVPAGEAARMGVVNDPKEIIAALNNPATPQEDIPRLKRQLADMVTYQQSVRPVTIQDTTGLVTAVLQNPKLWKSLPGEVKAKIASPLASAGFTDFAEEKPATQGEEVLAGYAARVKQANKGFENVTMGARERAWNKITPEFFNTDAGKVFAQDERNFINSVLRRESGAVISPSEFAEARKQYIPQLNDPPEALERKRQNRLIVQQNMIRGAGKAYVDPEQLIKEAAAAPSAGTQKSAAPKSAAEAQAAGWVPVKKRDGKTAWFPNKAEADAFQKRGGGL